MGADPEDRLSIEIGAEASKFESRGSAAARLSNQLADLISPLTEALGLVGDHLRVFRQRTLIEVLSKAHQIAQERGQRLRPVPPKFLLEWVAAASVEEDESGALKEMWAKLLVSASASASAQQLAYVDLLRKLTPVDAQLLADLASDISPGVSEKFYWYQSMDKFVEHIPGRVRQVLEENGDITLGQIVSAIEGVALQTNKRLLYVSSESGILATPYYRENEKSCAVLERENAVRLHTQSVKVPGVRAFQVSWLEITKFAFDFVWTCEGAFEGENETPAGGESEAEGK